MKNKKRARPDNKIANLTASSSRLEHEGGRCSGRETDIFAVVKRDATSVSQDAVYVCNVAQIRQHQGIEPVAVAACNGVKKAK